MQALWRPHLTLRDEFLQSLDLLEDLLVSRLSRSDARDFPRQLTIVLRDILNSSDRESWSGPSLIWDLCSFFGKPKNTCIPLTSDPTKGDIKIDECSRLSR